MTFFLLCNPNDNVLVRGIATHFLVAHEPQWNITNKPLSDGVDYSIQTW